MRSRSNSLLAQLQALFVFGGAGVLVLALILWRFPEVGLVCGLVARMDGSYLVRLVVAGMIGALGLFGVPALAVAALFALFQWARRKLSSRGERRPTGQ